jgi:DNA-binding transcriptional LysR family regulator
VTTTARLRALVAVAETGSVRAAAGRLIVTESAVSAAITALTREVGVPLVEREGRGLRLTTAGQAFAGYARTILGLHEEALAAARGHLDPEGGRVRVAAVTTAGEHVLPASLAAFLGRHPGVDLRLEVGTSEHVWALPGLDGVVVRAMRTNALVVVGAPAVAAGFDLARTTWLMREAGSGTRTTCDALLAGLETAPPSLILGSNGAVVAGAVAGLGVTLVSRDAVARQLAAGELVQLAIPGTPLRRPWHAVTHRVSPAATTMLVGHLLRHGDDSATRWRRPQRQASPSGIEANADFH